MRFNRCYYQLSPENIHIGPSDYVPWQKDNKTAFIRIEGTAFAGAKVELDLKLVVQDSPNSAGVVIDAIRCAKLAIDRNISGVLVAPSAAYMKAPPIQMDDSKAFKNFSPILKIISSIIYLEFLEQVESCNKSRPNLSLLWMLAHTQ